MTQNKPLFIIKTDFLYKESINLINTVLKNNYPVLIFIYENSYSYDIYYKYLGILKKQFSKYLNEKSLCYETYKSRNLDILNLLYINKCCLKYNNYVLLNPENLYFDNFFYLIDEVGTKNNLCIIKPYQSIDLNLKISTSTSNFTYFFTENILRYCLDNHTSLDKLVNKKLPDNYIVSEKFTNNILSFEHTNCYKYNVWEDKFKLIYLKENEQSQLKDSYCFFYTENLKCMNIENNIVGFFKIRDINNISIMWDNNGSQLVSDYIKSETDNSYRLVNASMDLQST